MSEPVTDQFGNTGYWIHNTTGQICDPVRDDLRQCFFSIDTRVGAGSRADAGLAEIDQDTLLDSVTCPTQSDPQLCADNTNCQINPLFLVENQDVMKQRLQANIRNPEDSWWSGRWKDDSGNWNEDNVCDLDGVSCSSFTKLVDGVPTNQTYIESIDLPEAYFQPLSGSMCQRRSDAVSTQSAWEQAQQQQCSNKLNEDMCNSYCDWNEAGDTCYKSVTTGDTERISRFPSAYTSLECGHCEDTYGNLFPNHTDQGSCEQSVSSDGTPHVWVGSNTTSVERDNVETSYEWKTRHQEDNEYIPDSDDNQGYCSTSNQITQTRRDQCNAGFFSEEELTTSFTPLYEVNAGQCMLDDDYKRVQTDSNFNVFDTINNGFVADVRTIDNVTTIDTEVDTDYFSEQSLARASGLTRTMQKDNQSTGVKGIVETSALSDYFFSETNIKVIQDTVRYRVYQETNLVVDYQSPQELFIIMRSILLQHANFKVSSSELLTELQALNAMVVNYSVGEVASNVTQYQGYLNDISRLPTPIDRPSFSDREINNTYDLSRYIGFS